MSFLKSSSRISRKCGPGAGGFYVFADEDTPFEPEPGVEVVPVPRCAAILAPIIHTLPLQLLAYYVAVLRGTDVDQPRNLAKSVTVE